MKNLTIALVFAVVFGLAITASAQEPTAPAIPAQQVSAAPVQEPAIPSAPGVYALVGSNYVPLTAPAIDRDMGITLFGRPSPKFIISGKAAAVQLETSRSSFLVVLSQPEFKGKYGDPHTWDILLANQKGGNRELPMKKGTKYSIGESDYQSTVSKVTPTVYTLTAAVDLLPGEYFLITGYNEKTKLPTGCDFGIVKK
jgi:hypothetical protein